MIDYAAALRALRQGKVRFIVVGGAAATLHGSGRLTGELELVYDRDPENVDRLVAALAPHAPYLRDAPAGLPFRFDAATVRRGLNFPLTTALGDLDLIGDLPGGGSYEELVPHADALELFGGRSLCLSLPSLIAVQRAAGRPHDFEALAELEVLLEERTR